MVNLMSTEVYSCKASTAKITEWLLSILICERPHNYIYLQRCIYSEALGYLEPQLWKTR